MILWSRETAAYLAARIGLKTGCVAATVLPRPWLYRFADTLANVAFHFVRDFRTRSTKNLAMALAGSLHELKIREIARQSLQNFFRDFVEITVALVISPEQLRAEIPIIGREHLDGALAKGNGVIALSAHLGNFFLVGTRLASEGYRTHVLVNQPKNGRFAKLMDAYRLQVRQQTIHARPRPDAVRRLRQVLRHNETAVIIADEYRNRSGIAVPFLGGVVSARRGPATIAMRTGAAVVPVCLVRNDYGTLKLVIEPELQLVRAGKSKEAIRQNTLLMTQWLERTVRAYPEQWNWMNIHWQNGAVRRTGDEKQKPT